MMTVENVRKIFKGKVCPKCGEHKSFDRAFCMECFAELPWRYRVRLSDAMLVARRDNFGPLHEMLDDYSCPF